LVVIKKGVGSEITENQSLKNRKGNSKIQIPEFSPLWREILGKPISRPRNPPSEPAGVLFSEKIHSEKIHSAYLLSDNPALPQYTLD
jgi:hypothetical protein